jgi:hypothetical protein
MLGNENNFDVCMLIHKNEDLGSETFLSISQAD